MPLGAHALPAQGFNPLHALIANILLDVITMLALVVIAHRLFGFPTALVVQILFALYVTWTPQLISETLFFTLFTSALALLVVNPDFKNHKLTAAFAIVNTLAVMTKPMAIILYAFVGLWVLRNLSLTRIARAALIATPLLLFIAIMFWRSHHYYGHMFLSSTGAQHVATHNYGFVWWDEHANLREQLGRVPTEYEVMDYFRQLKKQADREDPARAVGIYVKSFFQMFSWEPDWHMNWLWQANFHRHPDVAAQHQRLFRLSLWWYPLGLIGCIAFARKAPIPALTILLFFLLHAYVSPGHHRYMAPVNVLFMIFAGALLVTAARWTWQRLKDDPGNSPPATTSSPASSTTQ
ncbi:MAG TPA: hypothetical protein PKE55_14635 [Kiritimatiellia bacterium]|nr:hypothetical protein [Kiritimatiellia bacterium]